MVGLPLEYSSVAGLVAVRAAVNERQAARAVQEEHTLNWLQRVNLTSRLAAQKNRVGGIKTTTRGGPT